jgi:hypothetical protein
MSKTSIILIVTVITALVLGYIIYQSSLGSPTETEDSSATRPISSASLKKPEASSPTYQINRGIVESVTGSELIIKVGEASQTYSIAGTSDFQRITSGTFESNAQYAKATKADLKVGQEVLLAVSQGSNNVTTVFILR